MNIRRGGSIFLLGPVSLAVVFSPGSVSALTLVAVAEFFNIFVGLMLTMALLVFAAGLWGYFARLGTWPSNRDQPIRVMEWGVAVLFVLVVIVAVVQWFERNPAVASMLVGTIALLVIFGFILYVAVKSGKDTKKEE
jgi:membrane protease YdiL (CAAX protease family)